VDVADVEGLDPAVAAGRLVGSTNRAHERRDLLALVVCDLWLEHPISHPRYPQENGPDQSGGRAVL